MRPMGPALARRFFESRREGRKHSVRVWVPKEVWIREIERVLGRQRLPPSLCEGPKRPEKMGH